MRYFNKGKIIFEENHGVWSELLLISTSKTKIKWVFLGQFYLID